MAIREYILCERPIGLPDSSVFRMRETILSALLEGHVLVRSLYFSVDPSMRGRMNERKSYVPPFELDKPITGTAVGQVVESRTPKFKPGDIILGTLPWATESIVAEQGLQKIDRNLAPESLYLGLLGMTGFTAYFGLLDIGKPQAGETVVISSAAGAVGLVVGQLAKIHGCRVVGVVGSDEKARFLKEQFQFDQVINYKREPALLASAVEKACPKGVDIYFDNVGAGVSDAVTTHINMKGRIVLCGQIALYNSKSLAIGPRHEPLYLSRSVLMQGFIVSNYQARFREAFEALLKWYKEGKLKPVETVLDGFGELPNAFFGLFSGRNTGKMIVKVL